MSDVNVRQKIQDEQVVLANLNLEFAIINVTEVFHVKMSKNLKKLKLHKPK